MENKNISNSDNLKKSLCYIPLGGIILFFIEQNKSLELMKHIKYGTFLFIAYVLIRFVLVGILWLPFGGILTLLYIGLAGFFGFKAFKGEEVNIEYIDEFEKKFKENLNDSKKVEKKEESKNDK